MGLCRSDYAWSEQNNHELLRKPIRKIIKKQVQNVCMRPSIQSNSSRFQMLALTSMLVSAALGGILVWHPLSDKFLDDFRSKNS